MKSAKEGGAVDEKMENVDPAAPLTEAAPPQSSTATAIESKTLSGTSTIFKHPIDVIPFSDVFLADAIQIFVFILKSCICIVHYY